MNNKVIDKKDLNQFKSITDFLNLKEMNIQLQLQILNLQKQNAMLEFYLKHGLNENQTFNIETGIVEEKVKENET